MREFLGLGVAADAVHDAGDPFGLGLNPLQGRMHGFFLFDVCGQHKAQNCPEVTDCPHRSLHLVGNHRRHLAHDIAPLEAPQPFAVKPCLLFHNIAAL